MLPLPLPLIRVLDLTTSVAGATASRTLADFGAEVVVVERPDTPRDVMDRYGRNKFSCVIDASKAEGRDLLLRLAAGCHAVLKDEPDDALKDLDYDALTAVRDDIVLAVIVEGGESESVGDVTAGAVMTALFYVRFRGRGQQVTVSLPAVAASLRAAPVVAAASGASRLTPDLPLSGCYACADASVAIVVRSEEELAALCRIVGSLASGDEALRAAVATWAAGRHAHLAAAELNEHGIPSHELLANGELRDDPQLRARGVFESVASGSGVSELDGPRLRFSDTPLHTRFAASGRGEHADYVLRGLIGLSDAEFASLEAAGVVSGAT